MFSSVPLRILRSSFIACSCSEEFVFKGGWSKKLMRKKPKNFCLESYSRNNELKFKAESHKQFFIWYHTLNFHPWAVNWKNAISIRERKNVKNFKFPHTLLQRIFSCHPAYLTWNVHRIKRNPRIYMQSRYQYFILFFCLSQRKLQSIERKWNISSKNKK